MNRRIYALFALAFSIGILCLAPINNPPGGTGATGPSGSPGPAGSPGISGSPGPQGSPGAVATPTPIPTPTPAYLVYTALLTQTGTDAPVATVLQNTLGGTVVWTYSGTGTYDATLIGAFTANTSPISEMVVRIIDQPVPNFNVVKCLTGGRVSNDVYQIQISQAGSFADDLLTGTFVRIEVFP